MLRVGLGAFRGLAGGSAAQVRTAASTSAKRIWSQQLSTSSGSMSAPWHHRMGSSQIWAQRFVRSKQAGPRQLPRSSRGQPKRSFHSSRARRSDASENTSKKAAEPTSLKDRLKKLSREYGWAALGVYLGLSVLDFPFCFLLVRTVGTDRIAEVEHVVVSAVQRVIPESVKTVWQNYRHELDQNKEAALGSNDISDASAETAGWGVQEADKKHKEEASLATQLALAYAIHKSFIFVRVPLTAAVLPKVVKVLRSWGWQIGRQVRKR